MIYRLEDRAYDDTAIPGGGPYTFYTTKRASQRALAVWQKDWKRENKRRAALRAAGNAELEGGAYDLGPYPCPVETFATPTTKRGWIELLQQIGSHAGNG
jgi:hypothetical protein